MSIFCGLYHDENGYLCKSESRLLTFLKMVIRYDSAHRGLIYLLISLFFFHFHEKVSSSGACSSSHKIQRLVYTLNSGVACGSLQVSKSRADHEPITQYSIRKSRAPNKYSKTCIKRPLKKKNKNWFSRPITAFCRSKVLLKHSAMILTFIKLQFVFKTFVLSIFERPLKTGLL